MLFWQVAAITVKGCAAQKVLGIRELCKLLFAADEAMKTLPGTARYSVDIRKLTSAGKYLGKLVLFRSCLSTMENVAVNEACQALKLVLMQEMAKEEEKEKPGGNLLMSCCTAAPPRGKIWFYHVQRI